MIFIAQTCVCVHSSEHLPGLIVNSKISFVMPMFLSVTHFRDDLQVNHFVIAVLTLLILIRCTFDHT